MNIDLTNTFLLENSSQKTQVVVHLLLEGSHLFVTTVTLEMLSFQFLEKSSGLRVVQQSRRFHIYKVITHFPSPQTVGPRKVTCSFGLMEKTWMEAAATTVFLLQPFARGKAIKSFRLKKLATAVARGRTYPGIVLP